VAWSPFYRIKIFLRTCDCALTWTKRVIDFRGNHFPFYVTHRWDTASQQMFDDEIVPYFEALGDFRPLVILDVGAAVGHFGIVASRTFDCGAIYAFEPAKRQRVLLKRNARLNRVDRLMVEPFGLWDRSCTLPFRTKGAESSFAPAGRFPDDADFHEHVPVKTLDQWMKSKQLDRIDLIKIDSEGAELEILEGARATLTKFRPRLLVQAYHIRDGTRTFERCAKMLQSLGYEVKESAKSKGLLCAC
jgi:FkbM family methyltransferase